MDSEVPEGYKREMPFQVGLREAPEGRISEEETEVVKLFLTCIYED